MTRFKTLLAAAMALFALPVFAHHDGALHVSDPYAITRGAIDTNGAAYFTVTNQSAEDDRLVAVASDVARMLSIHTHSQDPDGVMSMPEVPEGFVVPANGQLVLERGGKHIMLVGLTRELVQGDTFELTLSFEHAGDIVITVPVDNEHQAAAAAHQHGNHSAAAAVDTTGMTDPEAIVAVMKAQFDTPENPLTVNPVTVEGDHAIASWSQGDMAGRALLERRHHGWEIVLCGGEDLRMPAFLGENGVASPDSLSALFNAAEDALGPELVSRASSFEGVVMISGPAAE
jgi:periplasmic copper chaperone A